LLLFVPTGALSTKFSGVAIPADDKGGWTRVFVQYG
jgi:hypothetical protein